MTDHMKHLAEVMEKAVDSPEDFNEKVEVSGLMARIVQANYNDYASTTKMLIESLQNTNARLEAELAAIREIIGALYRGRYMPNSSSVLEALYPRQEVVDQYRKDLNEEI